MDSLWLLLYSKFSPACSEIIEIIKANDTGIQFQPVCIDNSEVRRMLSRSKKFNIEYVPCILHISKSTGVAEQYEGERSFNLIQSLVESRQPLDIQQQPVFVEEQQPQPQPLLQQPQAVHSESMTMIDDLDAISMPVNEIKNVPAALKQKVSPGDIMAMAKGRENMDSGIRSNISIPPEQLQQQQIPSEKIEQKKTGKPVDISAALAAAQRRD